jgi:hypothetical protein
VSPDVGSIPSAGGRSRDAGGASAVRIRRRRAGGIAAILALGVAVVYAASLPPRALPAPPGGWQPSRRTTYAKGVIHIHTRRSDGSGTIDEVARAAARAGLDFVVLSDHGDGTRPPEPPAYRSGVLVLDAVEISTSGGHVLALGMPATPFRLAGRPRDVVEDIKRFGGLAIAAHPDSPKAALAWRDWHAPLDGFEWLNVDTEWRDETAWSMTATLFHYLLRGPESIAALFQRPRATLARWDTLSAAGRRLIAIGGADAHARLGWDDADGEDDASAVSVAIPSYETMFTVLSVNVALDAPLGGNPERDAAALLDGIAAGRTFTTIDAFARGGALEFWGEAGGAVVGMGQVVGARALSRLVARVRAPASAILRLVRNGAVIAETSGVSIDLSRDRLEHLEGRGDPAAYRVEVLTGPHGADGMPWIVSNPIWERAAGPASPPEGSADAETPIEPFALTLAGSAWRVEHDPGSWGALTEDGAPAGLRFAFRLAAARGDRWVAAALTLPPGAKEALGRTDAIGVRARAAASMRVSIQLRADSGTEDLRWTRSLFLDRTSGRAVLPIASFQAESAGAGHASRASASTLLVVIDRTNTKPGTEGIVWLERVDLITTPRNGPTR